jgi:hypothetical protein
VIRESIEIPPHLSLSAHSIPASLFVYGHHALGHGENATKADIRRWEKGNDDAGKALKRELMSSSKEGRMCPVCIASTAVVVAGAGSTGGILAVCIGKFRKLSRSNGLGLFQKTKEK